MVADGEPIPGLFAAGETTEHFYAMGPNAVAVLRARVFGRIAGREAVSAGKLAQVAETMCRNGEFGCSGALRADARPGAIRSGH